MSGRIYVSPSNEVVVDGWVSALDLHDARKYVRASENGLGRAENPEW